MNRYIKITIFTLVCFCININKMYACDQYPIPVMTSVPDVNKLYVALNDELTFTFGNNSYDPDNGTDPGDGIVAWDWTLEKLNGPGIVFGLAPNSSFVFDPNTLGFDPNIIGLEPGLYSVDINVCDDEGNWYCGYDYKGDTGSWSGIRYIYVVDIDYLWDDIAKDTYVPYGTGNTFDYSLSPDPNDWPYYPKLENWEPDILYLKIRDAEENIVYIYYAFGWNAEIDLTSAIEWDGIGNHAPYSGLFLPPGNYTATLDILKQDTIMKKTIPQTIYEVSIISPSASCDDNPIPASSWLADPNYRYDFQGIASGATGFYDLYIEGIISLIPPLSYKWTLTNIGSLNNDTTPTPTISNPTTGEGTLTLIAMNGETDTGVHDTRKIKIYPDHLARDVDNFKNGNFCSAPGTFIELPDGSLVPGHLSCASAATHALDGTVGSRTYLDNYSWSGGVTGDIPWNTFVTMNLQRGWVLELKHDLNGDDEYNFLHWQTVKTAGTGANAETYAADAGTHIFRHETVDDYYDQYPVPESKRKIKIYKP